MSKINANTGLERNKTEREIASAFYDSLAPHDSPTFSWIKAKVTKYAPGILVFDFTEISLPDECWVAPNIAPSELLVAVWENVLCTWNATESLIAQFDGREKHHFDWDNEIKFEVLDVDSEECSSELRESYANFVTSHLIDQWKDDAFEGYYALQKIINEQPASLQDRIKIRITAALTNEQDS